MRHKDPRTTRVTGLTVRFPPDIVMLALGGMMCGKVITVAPDGTLVLAASADADKGFEILTDEMAALERRRWIAFVGTDRAVATKLGEKWFRIWYTQRTGRH